MSWLDALYGDTDDGGRVPDELRCPRCARKVAGHRRFCPACGERVSHPARPRVGCECGRVFERGEVHCRLCGAPRPGGGIELTGTGMPALCAFAGEPETVAGIVVRVSRPLRAVVMGVAVWHRQLRRVVDEAEWAGRLQGDLLLRLKELAGHLEVRPEAWIVDGPGEFAELVGVAAGCPALSVNADEGLDDGAVGPERGDWAEDDGLAILRTGDGLDVIEVMPAHLVDPASACRVVLSVTGERVPDPLRAARSVVDELVAVRADLRGGVHTFTREIEP